MANASNAIKCPPALWPCQGRTRQFDAKLVTRDRWVVKGIPQSLPPASDGPDLGWSLWRCGKLRLRELHWPPLLQPRGRSPTAHLAVKRREPPNNEGKEPSPENFKTIRLNQYWSKNDFLVRPTFTARANCYINEFLSALASLFVRTPLQ